MGNVRVKLRKVTGLTWSRLGYTAGCLTASTGVGIEFGAAWGLVVAGVIGAASFLLLVDVDKRSDTGGTGGR